MKKRYWLKALMAGGLLLVFGLAIVGCGGQTPAASPTATPQAEPTTPPEPQLTGSPVRGGLLYDQFWVVDLEVGGHAGESEGEHMHDASGPEGDQPLWATQSTNTRSGLDTWRCKECHGWDYNGVDGAYGSGSHKTGFIGVFASKDKPASEVLAALQGSTNPDHDFSAVMDEQDLTDLALFITQATMDDTVLINADATAKGDAAAGETAFTEVCALCHGPTGNAINFNTLDDPEFLGHLAPDNPWEFVHKVRFGQPGWPMPSAIVNGWTNEEIANVLAYAQTLSPDAALSGGGLLYDKWWEALGVEHPEGDQPLWATQTTNERSGADTWRCKECHGWDYKGADGVYGSGSHATGFVGVLGTTPGEVMAWLDGSKNPDHDFSAVMEPFALEALVTFINQEMADIAPYVNADKTVNGDPAHGRDLFNDTCVACHGVDGKTINFGNAEEPEYVGTVASGNPWEFFHKATFGQPGTPMPMGQALGWSQQEIADLLSFAQTLPTK